MTDQPSPFSSQYQPKDTEEKWAGLWATSPLLRARVSKEKKPFTIVIPPPNVTGILHMGHALNDTLQDILIRMRRMQGFEALWMPGTDHAGIATQNVVERQLAREGVTRDQLGRDRFLERVWQWKKNYGSTITSQLKRLGATCDWSRERFTMDEGYSRAVTEVFVSLCEKGLIYQGDYIINWCPRCQTALSDEEAPHHDLDGKLYYIKYPLKEPRHARVQTPAKQKKSAGRELPVSDGIVVATTRPETMLGDTAVAVNPKDKRYKHLIAQTLVLPLMDREIKIIADRLVDESFGTGAVKVTPAHDPNDYQMGKTHDLAFINILRPDGVLNGNAGDYAGMDRFEAREAIVEELRDRKLLVKVEAHRHAVGHCYRCHTIVEPYLSKQWFVRMSPLAKPALDAVRKGKIKFTPRRWTKVYLNWMENVKDWCISRQIWWGHRIPVYYCENCYKPQAASFKLQDPNNKKKKKKSRPEAGSLQLEAGVIVSRTRPERCPACGGTDLKQDPDVLDTWFSSWLWPFATFGWPFDGCKPQAASSKLKKTNSQDLSQPEACSLQRKELDYFYPTNVLVTAPEIIFFWVARMITAGIEFMGKIPFSDVIIHGTVRDAQGRKMSKSLGNSIDPLEVVDAYGADALRFSLVVASASDIALSKEKFEQGRNFCNKIWNAARFISMNVSQQVVGDDIRRPECRIPDRWILSEMNRTIRLLKRAMDAYRFHEALNLLYAFFWHSFCDRYLEIAKDSINEKNTQEILIHVLKTSLALLHPFMPFVSDEISAHLPGTGASTLAVASWPEPIKAFDDQEAARLMDVAFASVLLLRERRHTLKLDTATKIRVRMWVSNKLKDAVGQMTPMISRLAQAEAIDVMEQDEVPANSLSLLVDPNVHLYLLLEGLVDAGREKRRLEEEILGLKKMRQAKEALLANKNFVVKAPGAVVDGERVKIDELNETIRRVEEVRRALQ